MVNGAPLRVAMLLAKDVEFDTRVKREAGSLAAAGHEIRVFAPRADGATGLEVRDGVAFESYPLRHSTRELWERHRARQERRDTRFARFVRSRAVRLAYLGKNEIERQVYVHVRAVAEHVEVERSLRAQLEAYAPDVVHAHDLATLHAGTRYAQRHDVPLVYDSHEFWVHSRLRRTRYERFVARFVERRGVRATRAVVTVSPGIADALAAMYRIPRPAVVLNSPWRAAARDVAPFSLRDACGLGAGEQLVVYVGLLIPGRGLHQTADGFALLPERVHLAILGPRKPGPERDFVEHVHALGLDGRVHLVDPVPGDVVSAVISSADAAVIPLEHVGLSYELTLPNKLFDAVLAGLPIATSDVRAVSEFVRRHELGAVFDVERPESIADAVSSILAGVPAGVADRARLAALQDELAWERQETVLQTLYRDLLWPEPRDTAS